MSPRTLAYLCRVDLRLLRIIFAHENMLDIGQIDRHLDLTTQRVRNFQQAGRIVVCGGCKRRRRFFGLPGCLRNVGGMVRNRFTNEINEIIAIWVAEELPKAEKCSDLRDADDCDLNLLHAEDCLSSRERRHVDVSRTRDEAVGATRLECIGDR